MIFNTENEKQKLKSVLKDQLKINQQNILDIANDIEIPKIEFNKIYNLLLFFKRVITSYGITIDLGNKIYELENLIINNMLLNMGLISKTDYYNQNILNELCDIPYVIKEDGEKTRKLIIEESIEIRNEIAKSFSLIPEEYRSKCNAKIWMFARHPEFIKPFEKLKEKGFITEEPMNYKFNFDLTKKGYGNNILAYFINEYADLSKWADSTRTNNKLNKDDEEKGFFTKRVYEPFSVAFDIPNLERNILNKGTPSKWSEFYEKAGLKDLKPVR